MRNNPIRRAQAGAALLMTALLCSWGAPQTQAAKPPKPRPANSIDLVPTINSISVVGGNLIASGTATATINGKTTTAPFTAPVNIALAPVDPPAGGCPVLDLTLGPINLDLLGLVVQTSPICLDLTAFAGQGLLGDLLCSVANLLQGGLGLNQILGGQGILDPTSGAVLVPALTAADIGNLLGGLQNLLNQTLDQLLGAILAVLQPGGGGNSCDILHLELGPVDLTLLGLEVTLNNCNGGPVVVDISAQRGRGNILGNLLCGLLGDGLINLNSTLGQILGQILGAL